MNDRKNALLLSGFLFLCVWLILVLVAVTETGGVKYNFAFAATFAALCGVVCMACYFTLDYMEKRKDASGIYDFEYYRLKRKKEGKQMKEYTIIYDAEITEVIKGDEFREMDKEQMAAWIESTLKVDDVHVKNLKVFEREL